jgi:hypothetical protein
MTWSPDSTSLALQGVGTDSPQSYWIFIVPTDGSPPVRIDAASDPVWSPDGRFLAVNGPQRGSDPGSLGLMNADGSGRHELSGVPSGASAAVVWVRQAP